MTFFDSFRDHDNSNYQRCEENSATLSAMKEKIITDTLKARISTNLTELHAKKGYWRSV